MRKLSIAMLGMMAAPLVFAQGGGQGAVFDQLEANKDGQPSTSEAKQAEPCLNSSQPLTATAMDC